MKLTVLAVDYDGTITDGEAPHPEVRAAIAEVRQRGIVTILVTGRILADLQRVAGDLRFVDAVVAENGAVFALPHTGRTVALGRPPPAAFVQEMRSRGLEATVGECIVETDAVNAPAFLAVLRAMGLPLALLFNRDRLMILPQGVSKGTGLREALRFLGLSEHNAIAIGDGENDHALLEACEIGAAVEWASPALRAAADHVICGDDPRAVAAYIREVGARERLPPDQTGRRTLRPGTGPTGDAVALAVRGRNLIIAGDSRSGKSWVAGLLCEQLILQRYTLCVLDPEGDHWALGQLPGVITLGAGESPPSPREVGLAFRSPGLSVVVDLSRVGPPEKAHYVETLLSHLGALRRRTGLPHRIVLDEAHHFLRAPSARSLVDPDLDGYTLITYRLADLDPEVRARCAAVVATRMTDPDEVRILHELGGGVGSPSAWIEALGSLGHGQAALLPPTEEAHGVLCRLDLAPRFTDHVRHRRKYVDVAVPEWAAFAFTRRGAPTGHRARTMRELVAMVREVPTDVLVGHLDRGDLSRWVADVFADQTLADRIRFLERGRPYEALSDLRWGLARLIEERYFRADDLS